MFLSTMRFSTAAAINVDDDDDAGVVSRRSGKDDVLWRQQVFGELVDGRDVRQRQRPVARPDQVRPENDGQVRWRHLKE